MRKVDQRNQKGPQGRSAQQSGNGEEKCGSLHGNVLPLKRYSSVFDICTPEISAGNVWCSSTYTLWQLKAADAEFRQKKTEAKNSREKRTLD